MTRHRNVRWVAAVAALIMTAGGVSEAVAPGSFGRARAYLSTLTVKHIGAPDGGAPLQPFPVDDPPLLRLAAAGDVGTGGGEETRTAYVMQQVAESRPFDALILLGDNVYPDGNPTRLQTTVFEPFAPLLGDGTRVFAVLGNHDVQQDHADGHAAALGMPGRWYAEHLGPMLFVGLDSTEPRDPDQLKWLEDTLAAATEPWRIVALHHPPYSAGQHGSDKDVRDAFAPLFARYGVQLVLAGHDHDYQRSEPIDGVTYIVSGGAATLRSTGRAGFTAVSWSTYHFLDIAVWADHLTVRAIGHDKLVHDVVELRLNQQRNSSERPGDGGRFGAVGRYRDGGVRGHG